MRLVAALLALAAAGTALAGPTIEIDPRTEDFASRAACEKALKQRHAAALSRLDSLSEAQRRGNKVAELKRDGDEHLSYAEILDLGGDPADSLMPRSQTESFTCRGAQLEHRIDLAQ